VGGREVERDRAAPLAVRHSRQPRRRHRDSQCCQSDRRRERELAAALSIVRDAVGAFTHSTHPPESLIVGDAVGAFTHSTHPPESLIVGDAVGAFTHPTPLL
jgi:hypothetical protein